jgi:NAD(P)-dependent dehydrogenase (short-subunit alcohol dehydrogenase family)
MDCTRLFDLTGRAAIVTGAGSGLGRAMALGLAQYGADVVVPDLNLDAARSVASEIESLGHRSLPLRVDVTNADQVNDMVSRALAAFGKIDILVNNAGVNLWKLGLFVEEDEWDRVVDTNLKGVFLCAQAVGRVMRDRRYGKIINLASIMGIVGLRYCSPYVAAKGGVVTLTKALALEWARYNVNVNAIAPGFARTPMTQSAIDDEAYYRELTRDTPMGRFAEPEEMVGACLFLASDASSFITGVTIPVDGGYTAR